MLKGSSSSLTPTSHRYFSQRLRMHYVEWGPPKTRRWFWCMAFATTAAHGMT